MAIASVMVASAVREGAFADAEQRLRGEVTMTAQMTSGALFAPLSAGDTTLQAPITDLARSVHTHLMLLTDGGSVVADSAMTRPEQVPNQAKLPEVVAARRDGHGRAVRGSGDDAQLWVAQTIKHEGIVFGIVRASLPIARIAKHVDEVQQRMALAGLLALALGGCIAVVIALKIAQPIKRLAAAAKRIGDGERGTRVSADGRDDNGDLGRALNDMALKLEHTLSEVERKNLALRRVFDTIDQGLVMVDCHGVLAGEHSTQLERWFGEIKPGMRVWELFAGATPTVRATFELGFQALDEALLPAALVIDQLCKRVLCSGQVFELEYRPIFESEDRVAQVLMSVTDVTARSEAEAREAVQKSLTAMFERATRDATGVRTFLEEGQQLIEATLDPNTSQTDLRRNLHTLKGNTLMYSVIHIAELCHQLESNLDEQETLSEADRQHLAQSWHGLRDRVKSVIGSYTSLAIPRASLCTVIDALRAGEPRATLIEELEQWTLPRVDSALQRLADHARALGVRLNKGEVLVVCEADGSALDEAHSGFWGALVHAVRNAIDHGIEPMQEREQSGKPRCGRLTLRAHVHGDQLVVEVEDDGRGIAWERVAERMRRLGHEPKSHDDLVEGLFLDGMSTAAETTSTSGRGVGMSALRSALNELHGHIEVESRPGAGTVLRCRLPARVRVWRSLLPSKLPATG